MNNFPRIKKVEQLDINGLSIHRIPSSFALPINNKKLSYLLKSFILPISNTYLFKTNEDKWDIVDLGLWRENDPALEHRYNIIKQYPLNKIILTHYHFDHFAGVIHRLKNENPDIPIVLFRPPEPKVSELPHFFTCATTDLYDIYTKYHKIDTRFFNTEITQNIYGESQIKIGTLDFNIIPTPGHSYDGCSFFNEKHRLLLTGDTVVTASSTKSGKNLNDILPLNAGGLGLETADENDMRQSLFKLSELPFKVLLPGHGNVIIHERLPSVLKRDSNKMIEQALSVTKMLHKMMENA